MVKRVFDLLFAITGIIILSPVFAIISLVIVFDSKGGLIYTQCRVGKYNRDFKLYKFRTMYVGASKKGLLTVGLKDPRITRSGLFIRKYKLDELPQLFNVVAGHMSFVGPRPEVREYVDLYTPDQKMVLRVRPGITDYASIQYINEDELLGKADNPEKTYIEKIMPAKLQLNLKYIEERNLWLDVKLICKTISGIF